MMSLLGFRPRQSGLAGRLTDDCPTQSSRRAEAGATAARETCGYRMHHATGLRIRLARKLPGTRNDTEIECRRDTMDALS
jgi:hypothetical protein